MASFQFKGLEKYEQMLSSLSSGSRRIAGKAVYAGAKIIADQMRKEIESLKVSKSSYATPGHPSKAINPAQQKGLLDGLGIASIQEDNGYIHVKVGFDGYNSLVTRAHPKGQPNAEVARSLQKGTSYMIQQPFVTRAVKKSRNPAEKEMAKIIEAEIEALTKKG